MSTLATQVDALRYGDTVTVTLNGGPRHPERIATLTGEVWGDDGSIRVGPTTLRFRGGGQPLTLVSIDSVTPKPLDEPIYHGAMTVDSAGDVWARDSRGLWVCIDDPGPRPASWDALDQRFGPLTPFVPTPDEEAGR